jgi:zinc protease
MPFPEPVSTEVDGVPVWYTDVGGPCMGGLVFRTGRADETLPTAGINHLVEHLALFPLWDHGFDMNGTAAILTTSFFASGTQRQTESFLTELCRSLGALPMDRLDDERQVVETEARSSGMSFAGSASARFGPRGFGIVDWFDFGVQHLTADAIQAWAAERFTKGQAAAWMTRPPTPELRLELPPGDPLPIPTPEPIPSIRLPSHIHGWGPHMGCSFMATRSMPLFIATAILRERAMRAMRREKAITYSVGRSEERVGPRDSLYFITFDTAERHVETGLQTFMELLEKIAGGEISAAEVQRGHAASMPWNATDAERPVRETIRKATASLFGRTPTTWKALAKQGERLKPERVASALREGLDTAILVVPEGLAVPDRYAARPTPPPNPPVNGRVYVRWDGDTREETILGSDGVTQRSGVEALTVLFDEVEAAPLGPDGTLNLIDRRGIVMTLQPNQLMRGKVLAETLADRVGDRVIDLRRDVVGWFELQSLVENHDPEAIKTVWREIEHLAKGRDRDERILVIAFANFGRHRGLVAATDRRVVHVSARRHDPLYWWHREELAFAELSTGLRGRRLRITTSGGRFITLDRVRPRAQATELQRLLTPIGDG